MVIECDMWEEEHSDFKECRCCLEDVCTFTERNHKKESKKKNCV